MDHIQLRCEVIAEAGVNHNGSPDLAMRLVEAAAAARADLVKFQTFSADKLATADAAQSEYQRVNTGRAERQIDMLRRLELGLVEHRALKDAAEAQGIGFLSTPFDEDSARFLIEDLGCSRLKIGSGDLTNAPLLLACARLGQPIIVSTGMADLSEIEEALGVLALGYVGETNAVPSAALCRQAYASDEGQAALRAKVTVLQCTTQYPAPPEAINLRAMDTIRAAFGLPTGYSDHSMGSAVALAAVARGACAIEKHFTLDRAMEGPDHKCSLEPDELADLVLGIRTVEAALGSAVKRPGPVERPNIAVARKSVVAATAIAKGEVFCADNLTVKRPGDGLAPIRLWELIGKPAPRAFAADEQVSL
ncbi:MAG: N-acetylneuraminate synthase [Neomegalonema sp.]|nr:N-acetylneuraminate synthase [Neomegalonema sp.]